jgi:hypothetical protein
MGTTLDHELFADLFGTAHMRAQFDGAATLQAWLDVERALAEAEAEVGEIPTAAAMRIAEEARADRFDLAELAKEILVGLRRQRKPALFRKLVIPQGVGLRILQRMTRGNLAADDDADHNGCIKKDPPTTQFDQNQ